MAPLIFAVSLLSTSPAFAEAHEDFDDLDLIVVNEDEDIPASSPTSSQDPIYAHSSRKTTHYHIQLGGDFLYWKAEQQGLEYGLQSINYTTNPPLPNPTPFKGVNGKISTINSDYHAGYRLHLTYQFPYDEWDLFSAWTMYKNHQNDDISIKSGKVVFPDWLDGNFFPLPRGAEAHWKISFNTLEVNLGRAFYAGKYFSIKPFAGFKAAWINQTLDVNYLQVTFSNNVTSAEIKTHNRNNLQAYGVDGGFTTKWNLDYGLYLYGTASGSLLWSEFDVAQFSKEVEDFPRSKLEESVHEVTFQWTLVGGIAWERQLYKDRLYLNIHAGWEEQVWFDINQLNRYVDPFNQGRTFKPQGDLSLYGWTIGATLGF